MRVTGKLKPVGKTYTVLTVFPKITFLPFFSKKIHMAIKQPQIAAHIIFMNRQIKLNTRNFKIVPYNEEKYKLDMVRYFCSSVKWSQKEMELAYIFWSWNR